MERVEEHHRSRLDRGAVRSLLWALPKYWYQFRIPLAAVLAHSAFNPRDAHNVCLALTRFSSLAWTVSSAVESGSSRQRFLALVNRPAGPVAGDSWSTLADEAGRQLREETAMWRVKLIKEQVRLTLFAGGVLAVHADGGGARKEKKLLDVIRLAQVASLKLDDAKITIQMGDKCASTHRSFQFESCSQAPKLFADLDACWNAAKNVRTSSALALQVSDCTAWGVTAPLPAFVVILVQFLSANSRETFTESFGLPISDLKVSSLFTAYDSTVSDAKERSKPLVALLPSAGLQNVLQALVDYFYRLPEPLLPVAAKKTLLCAVTEAEFRTALDALPSVRAL